MDDRFFTACFPGSVRVCGRRLNSFSAYHYLMLRAIGSPLMDSQGRIRPGDLLAAVRVCRHRFGEPVDLFPNLRDIWWKLRLERSKDLFRRECEKLAGWISSHSSGPQFWTVIEGGQATRDLTGPEVLTLIIPVMMQIRISEAEAWDMSLGRLQWLHAEIQEVEGSTRRFLYEQDLEDDTGKEAANA